MRMSKANKQNINWLVFFTSLPLTSKTLVEKELNLMLCVSTETKNRFQIETSATGFKAITVQNLVRKLTEAIDRKKITHHQILPCIQMENNFYQNSKTYQNFVKKNSECFSKIETIEYQNQKQTFLNTFLNSVVEKKTLQEAILLNNDSYQKITSKSIASIVSNYIKDYNQQMTLSPQLKLQEIETYYSEVVQTTPFELTYENKREIESIQFQIKELQNILQRDNSSLANFLEQQTNQLKIKIESLDANIHDVGTDIKKLLPNSKKKHQPQELRDPMTPELLQLALLNAGSASCYQKKRRQSQLKITYTILYFVGLRVNELRTIPLSDIQNAIQTGQLRIVLFKTNRAHTYTLSKEAIQCLQKLQPEFDCLMQEHNYKYIFGKKNPPHKKTILRIINEDLKRTSKLCNLGDRLTSHSFRIGLISRLLRVTNVQTVAHLIGHQDIRSTMVYNRFKIPKPKMYQIYSQAEENENSNDFSGT